MNNTNIIAQLIEIADAAKKEKSFYSFAVTYVDGVGEIHCLRSYGNRKQGRPVVARSNFELNGKKIAVSNLVELLK